MTAEVATIEHPHMPASAPAASDATSLMEVISRAASDPNVDVDKLERLMGMYERISAGRAKAAYAAALSEMQPNLPVITERGEIKGRDDKVMSKYALWEDINDAIRPVLAEHGFALSFRTGRDGEHIVVTAVLSHREGHSETTTLHLPIDTSGAKNAVQAVGSSTSYGKRYTASALLNLTSGEDDDDGRAGGGAGPITEEQATHLRAIMDEVGADVPKFCAYLGVPSVAEIPASQYDRAVKALEAKRRKR